jgi:CRISPR/Cas system CSM-associated protein Csm2 small subunit
MENHELKTALTALKLRLQLSKRRNGDRSSEFVEALDFCLLQTKRIEVLMTELELGENLGSLVDFFEASIARAHGK